MHRRNAGVSEIRRAKKRDTIEADIFEALVLCGCQVLRLDQFDLLVLRRGRITMLEVKTGNAPMTKSQKMLLAEGWPLKIVRSVPDALAAVGFTVYSIRNVERK